MTAPAAYAEEVVARLQAAFLPLANPEAAVAASKYMRSLFPFLGIPSTARRLAVKAALAGLPPPAQADLDATMTALWALDAREYQHTGLDLVTRHIRRCDATFLETLRMTIVTKSWWDTVDGLASNAVGPLVAAHPELVTTMDAWLMDENLWLARTAIIYQLGYRERTDEARLFHACLARAHERDFFIRKAIGWALREYSKTDPAAVVAFVEAHAAALSPLSRREALKWLMVRPTGKARAAALGLS